MVCRYTSLIATCKLHGHEPYAYLKHVFKEVATAEAIEQYEALMPWRLDADNLRNLARDV